MKSRRTVLQSKLCARPSSDGCEHLQCRGVLQTQQPDDVPLGRHPASVAEQVHLQSGFIPRRWTGTRCAGRLDGEDAVKRSRVEGDVGHDAAPLFSMAGEMVGDEVRLHAFLKFGRY